MQAAVAQGAFEKVAEALISYCFTASELIDDVHRDGEEAMAVRHGIDRERLRLTKVASKEGARIRLSVELSCVACGAPLTRGAPVDCHRCHPSPQPSGVQVHLTGPTSRPCGHGSTAQL
ncbi:hypothetical protein OG906_37990 (plasmid) [Streptomyces sp. NBC_01426]|uniref:hypothetical protein n=1 Tax=Streptomyces sp. NBC_01426 TaxID=2975866 RepID=UPI002E359D88|nr:hypothetical protein [Streptomyces sp. NBC_01426]